MGKIRKGTRTYADDFFVGHAGDEEVLLFLVGVELDAVWHLLVGVARDDLARLRVPQFDEAVVGGRQELFAGVVEADVAHGLPVAVVGADAAAVLVDLPDLDFAVHAAAEQQVGRLGEPADGRHALVVALPHVDLLLRDETLGRRRVRAQVDADVLRRV